MVARYTHLSPDARDEAVRLLEKKTSEAAGEVEKQVVNGDQTETAGLQVVKPSGSEVL